MILSRWVVWAVRNEQREENAALIICTRTSPLSCGGRTRPLQLWHSALPRLQPSCSTRIPFGRGYFTNRLHPSGVSDLPLLLYLPTPFSSCIVLPRSLAHFTTDIARVPFHSEKFNYNRNYHSKKVSLANARHLTSTMIPSFVMVVPSCEREMTFFLTSSVYYNKYFYNQQIKRMAIIYFI